ncbi:MAG: hypothetical protein ACK55Z_25355, partial [bacterium]
NYNLLLKVRNRIDVRAIDMSRRQRNCNATKPEETPIKILTLSQSYSFNQNFLNWLDSDPRPDLIF